MELKTMKPAVFLDRDNTLIHNDADLGDPSRVRMIQGAASAIASLRGLGYQIVVVSNQGGVARGMFGPKDVEAVNDRINELIRKTTGASVDRFYYCPYHPDGAVKQYACEHPWRKPAPGMLLQAADDMQIDLARSWTVGDQLRDVQAGIAAGTRTILLQEQSRQPAVASDPIHTGAVMTQDLIEPHFTATSLVEAVKIVASARAVQPRRVKPPSPEGLEPRIKTIGLKGTLAPADPSPSTDLPPATASSDTLREPIPLGHVTTNDSTRQNNPDPLRLSSSETADDSHARSAPVEHKKRKKHTDDNATFPEIPETSSGVPTIPVDRTLREILQELRNQRKVGSDFSYTTVFAIVLQMVAAVCLLGALALGGTDTDLFMRWISVGILLELATIVILLLRR